jgi:hypothetical protein
MAAGEAMQDGGESAPARFLLQYSRHVLVRLARMNDERQAGCARDDDVIAEALFLRRARASLIVIIEPGFSDCDHFGMTRSVDQFVDGDVELLVSVVWMGPHRAIDLGKALGDAEHLGVPLDPHRDGDDAPNAGGAGARDDGVEFAGKIGKVEVAMAVDQHGS